jgi:DNA repair exonuclease SbcCD ATPase subunit
MGDIELDTINDSVNEGLQTTAMVNAPTPRLPGWCIFALGSLMAFLFLYVGVARPLTQELASMRVRFDSVEHAVSKLASHRGNVAKATQLVAMLAEQGRQSAAASKSMQDIRSLYRQVEAEAREARRLNSSLGNIRQLYAQLDADVDRAELATESLDTIRQLCSQIDVEADKAEWASEALAKVREVNDAVLENADEVAEAADALAAMERLHERLSQSWNTTYEARRATDDLIALEQDLIAHGADAEPAQAALDSLVSIRQQLDDQGHGVFTAQQRMEGLLILKDTVVKQTDDIADAIETLELTSDLQNQVHEAVDSFQRLRSWMIEVVALDPMLDRAMATLQPLTDLGNLRRISSEQLRQVARAMTDRNGAKLARNPLSTQDATNSASSPVLVSGVPAAE